MAARNRPRGVPLKEGLADAHEERNMWNQIVNDLRRLKTNQVRATEVSKAIVELESTMPKCTFVPFLAIVANRLFLSSTIVGLIQGISLINRPASSPFCES